MNSLVSAQHSNVKKKTIQVMTGNIYYDNHIDIIRLRYNKTNIFKVVNVDL